MKNLILLLFVLFAVNLSAQRIDVTLITPYSGEEYPAYNFTYDKNSKQWAYSIYDTANNKSILLGSKGNSDYYDFIADWNIIFDDSGNYYTYAYNYRGDEKYVYFLLKNGKQHSFYDNIVYMLKMYKGKIYFLAEQNEESFLVVYDISRETIEKGKHYEKVYCYPDFDQTFYREPTYTISFTSNDEPIYIAEEMGKKFIVTGEREGKRYDDIVDWYAKKDLRGNICYVAVVEDLKGRKEFVVQGDKEYKKFYGISYIDTFTVSNVPVYAVTDSISPDKTVNYVVIGNDIKSRKLDTWISNIEITPSGKLAYSGGVLYGKDKYKDVLYIEDEEIASYESISSLKFDKKGKPLFVAAKNEKSFVIYDDEQLDGVYTSIYNAGFLEDGSVYYSGIIYGDYEKNIADRYYVHIGDKKLGPFDGIGPMGEYGSTDPVSDKNGNYAFLVSYVKYEPEYSYKYAVYSNKFVSNKYDYISQFNIFKGNIYYFAEKYSEDYFYYDEFFKNNVKIGDTFQNPGSINYDVNKEIYSFTCVKDGYYGYVEIDLNQ